MFKGAMTALVTPLKAGAVDDSALAALIESQIEAGIRGLVLCGTTGESATLDADEKERVIRVAVQAASGRVPIIAGVGANSTDVAVGQSRAAKHAGADGLLHVTPYYNKPTQEGLFQHFLACSKATDLPILLYNVPARTHSDLLPDTIKRLAEVPTILGIKEATGDMARAGTLVRELGANFTISSGDDFSALSLMALGGHGVISVVSNVAPGLVAKMTNAATSGNFTVAQECHHRLMPLCELLFKESNPIPVKAALAHLGRIQPDIRLPLTPCSPELLAMMVSILRAGDLS